MALLVTVGSILEEKRDGLMARSLSAGTDQTGNTAKSVACHGGGRSLQILDLEIPLCRCDRPRGARGARHRPDIPHDDRHGDCAGDVAVRLPAHEQRPCGLGHLPVFPAGAVWNVPW